MINTNDPASVRSDGTVKDIDMVVFTPDHSKVLRARRTFAKWSTEAETQGLILPKISMEAARHPGWPKRNLLKQFVTAWEIDQQNIPHLVFGALDQALNPASIEPWTIDLGNGNKITIFNPVAHALCYALRVPSGIKRKDREKIGEDANGQPYSRIGLVNGLGYEATKLGFLQGVDYNDMYKEWACYIEALRKRPDPLTRVKGMVTGFYWDTIGTQVAHGSGIFAGLSKFGDKMAG